MRMIACMSPQTGGTLRVLGMDPETDGPAIRSRIGLVPQEDTLDLELTVLDNLMIYGRYFDLPRRSSGSGPTACSTSPSSPSGPTTRSSRCRAG
jgi:ABC-type multidrug transport system ATPase subunit